jgi:hypothetical protein
MFNGSERTRGKEKITGRTRKTRKEAVKKKKGKASTLLMVMNWGSPF